VQAGLACEACALSQEFVHLRLSIKPVSRDQSARSFLLTESRCVVCGAGAAECRGGCGRGTAHQRSVRRRDIGSRAEAGLKGVIFLKLSAPSPLLGESSSARRPYIATVVDDRICAYGAYAEVHRTYG
jgi:hypothetical protein